MVLSRGYGRKTKGFHYVLKDEAGDHLLWGDEPLQIKYRFPNVVVAVCEDRVGGGGALAGRLSGRSVDHLGRCHAAPPHKAE